MIPLYAEIQIPKGVCKEVVYSYYTAYGEEKAVKIPVRIPGGYENSQGVKHGNIKNRVRGFTYEEKIRNHGYSQKQDCGPKHIFRPYLWEKAVFHDSSFLSAFRRNIAFYFSAL